jgi:predicted PurR-regulated permease PerM
MSMKEYLRELQHKARYSGHGHDISKFKKLLIIGGVIALLVVLFFIVLIIWAATWLFNRGEDQLRQTTQQVSQQADSLSSPLRLESYVTDNQVDTQKIQDTYEALPSQIQGLWLEQFEKQLNELKTQAGISDQTIQTLTSVYTGLQQLGQ